MMRYPRNASLLAVVALRLLGECATLLNAPIRAASDLAPRSVTRGAPLQVA